MSADIMLFKQAAQKCPIHLVGIRSNNRQVISAYKIWDLIKHIGSNPNVVRLFGVFCYDNVSL